MAADLTEVVVFCKQAGLRRKQVPLLRDEIPLVNLNALRVGVKCELVSFGNANAAAFFRQVRPVGVIERESWCDCESQESDQDEGLKSAIEASAVHDFSFERICIPKKEVAEGSFLLLRGK